MLEQKIKAILADEKLTKEDKNAKIYALVKFQNEIDELVLEREECAADAGIHARTRSDKKEAYENRKYGWA